MKVAISKLTLTRGNAQPGGVIFNNNDDVTLRQCRLTQNVSLSTGGAYFANDGRLTVEDSEFLNNRSVRGGAIRARYSVRQPRRPQQRFDRRAGPAQRFFGE